MMLETPFPKDVEAEIFTAYNRLGERIGKKSFEVAVRSSATAEDLRMHRSPVSRHDTECSG